MDRKERQREAQARYRSRLRASGIQIAKPRTEDQKKQQREAMARKRADARAKGVILKTDQWAAENPDRHRDRVQKWREANPEKAKGISRTNQATRRSTPWGAINNRIWSVMHKAVRSGSPRRSKYTDAMGHLWSDLRVHLEAQFSPEMNWDNWGDVWEMDHIKPVSSFKYESLADPLFRECWALPNIRPLSRAENAAKGNRVG